MVQIANKKKRNAKGIIIARSPIENKKSDGMKKFFRTMNKGARVAALVGLLGLGAREGVESHKARSFRNKTVSELVSTESGRNAAKIYTGSLRRRNPNFKREVELRTASIRVLEKALEKFNAKHNTSLTVSRMMYTLERSSLLNNYSFNAGQIRYAPTKSVKQAYELFNELPKEVRQRLFDMSRLPETHGSIKKQALIDGYSPRD